MREKNVVKVRNKKTSNNLNFCTVQYHTIIDCYKIIPPGGGLQYDCTFSGNWCSSPPGVFLVIVRMTRFQSTQMVQMYSLEIVHLYRRTIAQYTADYTTIQWARITVSPLVSARWLCLAGHLGEKGHKKIFFFYLIYFFMN